MMKDLGTLGGGNSRAYAINSFGQVVGASQDTDWGEWHAVLWENDSMTELGTLCGDSYAWDINKQRQVVGWSNITSAYNPHAFLWENGVMTDLGTLGGAWSEAYAINDAGWVVGEALIDSGDRHACLWSDGVMTDLNTLLPEGSGWELKTAYDINNNGRIVGYGYINGESHAFLMVPEPATLLLLGFGAVMLLRKRTL